MQDPKEATRERIERLKKEGAVELEEPSSDKGAIPPAKVPALKQGRAAATSEVLVMSQSCCISIPQHKEFLFLLHHLVCIAWRGIWLALRVGGYKLQIA